MLEHADVLIAFKEYPHTDFLERGQELSDLLERCARNGWRPARAVFDCRTIGRFHTMHEPMKGFVPAMTEAEGRPGIASISLVHGFPWGDVADMGAKCLVLADTTDLANANAQEFGSMLRAIRRPTFNPPLTHDETTEA